MFDIEMISAPGDMGSFSFESAYQLLNYHVVRKSDLGKTPAIENMGYVAGMVQINDEVEVIIKFMHGVVQLTRHQFEQQMHIIDDEDI